MRPRVACVLRWEARNSHARYGLLADDGLRYLLSLSCVGMLWVYYTVQRDTSMDVWDLYSRNVNEYLMKLP
jgi:hypothetical protein